MFKRIWQTIVVNPLQAIKRWIIALKNWVVNIFKKYIRFTICLLVVAAGGWYVGGVQGFKNGQATGQLKMQNYLTAQMQGQLIMLYANGQTLTINDNYGIPRAYFVPAPFSVVKPTTTPEKSPLITK